MSPTSSEFYQVSLPFKYLLGHLRATMLILLLKDNEPD